MSQKHFRNISETIKACTGLILDHTPKSIKGVKNFLFPGSILLRYFRLQYKKWGEVMHAAADVT